MPTKKSRTPSASITGRDNYIIFQALATTFALIGELPERCQAASNRHDMARLLRAYLGEDWKNEVHYMRHCVDEAEWKSGPRPFQPDAFDEPE